MIPYNEDKFLDTELGRGLCRREALDLLAYTYTETKTGNFSVSGDLGLVSERYTIESRFHQLTLPEKGQIEELVRISYQALERSLEERSRTVINERGWGEAINAMNRGMPGMQSREPWAAPQYPPSRPEYWNQDNPRYDNYPGYHPYSAYENIAPIEGGREEQTTRPEVRFTLPRAQLFSDTPDIAKKAQTNLANTIVPSLTDDEKFDRDRLIEQVAKAEKEQAEKDKNTAIHSFVISSMKTELEKIRKQLREEQEKPAAPLSQNEQDKTSRRTEVETESEYSGDEDGSEAEALND